MRFIAGLIALAGIAGLVALLAPLDGGSLLPAVLQHGDGALKLKFVVVTAAFGLAAVFGVMAIAKERMSRLHSVCTLVGFAAAAFVLEIWKFIQSLVEGMNQRSLSALVLGIAIVLGLVASIAAFIKSRATY